MKKKISFLAAALVAFGVSACDPEPSVSVSVEDMPPLAIEGTNPPQGVAGAFSTKYQNFAVVAGGCNFPDKGPADGGKKVYFNTLWTLDMTAPTAWRADTSLPLPVAYGVAAGANEWVGGENSLGKLDLRIRVGVKDAVAPAPFPVKIDSAAAAPGFVAGGNIDGVPANRAFALKSAEDRYEEIAPFPGKPRVQPVGGILKTPFGDAFAVVGGFYFDKEKNEATLDRAGAIYYPAEKKWEPLPPMPEALSEAGLVGSVAVPDGLGGLLIFGGVNAKIFKDAVENPAPDYLRHDPAWYKFNADILRLSVGADGNAKWEKLATVPATARAGAAAIVVSDAAADAEARELRVLYVGGELKPGFRSPDCVLIRIEKK